MEELNKLSTQLLKLGTNHDWQTADETCKIVSSIFGIDVERFKLWHDPRIVAEASRFMTAFETINNPAAYEVRHSNEKKRAIDIKLYWMKKSTKTNLSWVVGAADNFEDSTTMQHKDIGIDLVIPESCDRIFVIISNQYKLRVLELHNHLSITDREILTSVINLKNDNVLSLSEKTSYHSAIWDAFNFEPINKRFYRELVDRFIVLRDHLILKKDITSAEAVSFSTRLIGRLLFVKFLDKKGLINSSIEYFNAPAGDSKIQTTYYKEKLEALFYKTLNTEIPDRGFSDIITPYLNGGLFDASDSDFYDKNIVTFPDNYFSVFQSILAKYNFTVDESSPEFQQVAVDPEMLGRIFESLLGEMETKEGDSLRSATGAFYTPREIVSYMCEQSILEYLKSKITDSPERDRRLIEIITMSESLFRDQDQNKRRDWKPYVQPILDALEKLTVLDPAVGSGAYPMGMLHLLIKIYTRLDSKYEKNLSKLKRDILSRSLYGSDISTTAIEICRLRAWLSLIVDISQGEQVVPLPNLEFHFVCANTLISLNRQSSFNDTADLKENMKKIREDYYGTNSKKQKETLKRKYEKLLNPSQASLLSENDNILKTYRPFTHESVAGFFNPELMLGQEKFDIVIGNPPYVGEKGNKETFRPIAESPIGKRFYQGKMDLFYFFFHIALDYLNEGGVMAYITTNYYITATGAGKLRKDIRDRASILKLLNFGELKIFESALGQHNMITMLIKGKNDIKANTLVSHKKGYLGVDVINSIIQGIDTNTSYYEISQDELYSGNNIKLTNGDSNDFLDKIKNTSVELKDVCNINTGIQSGAYTLTKKHINKYKINGLNGQGIFSISKQELENLNLDKQEYSIIKPFYKNSDIFKYFTSNINKKYLIYITKSSNEKNFPGVIEHLKFFKPILEEKREFKNGRIPWFALQWPREESIFRHEKILAPIRSKVNTFGYNDYEFYVATDVNVITVKDKRYSYKLLLGILNSNLVLIWLKNNGKSKGSMLELVSEPLSHIPIPEITQDNKKNIEQVEKLVDQILIIKKENKDADTKNLEQEIDQLVYKLYDLTPEEIEIVENSSKK